jgi:hypothetical protein
VGDEWSVWVWPKGRWKSRGGDRSHLEVDIVVSEAEAQTRFLRFVKGTTVLEYNGIDESRLLSWLESGGHRADEAPKFFDLGRGRCFPAGRSHLAIFGPHEEAISRSPTATLHIITDNLFVLHGRSCSTPLEPSVVQPYITDVNIDGGVKWSDEVLDCQRLLNLFMVLRFVYNLVWQGVRSAS